MQRHLLHCCTDPLCDKHLDFRAASGFRRSNEGARPKCPGSLIICLLLLLLSRLPVLACHSPLRKRTEFARFKEDNSSVYNDATRDSFRPAMQLLPMLVVARTSCCTLAARFITHRNTSISIKIAIIACESQGPAQLVVAREIRAVWHDCTQQNFQ
jgi:hypothetical protein